MSELRKCDGCGLLSASSPAKHIRLLNGDLDLCSECLAEMNRKAPRPALFQTGDFTLASGAKSRWKLECDALTMADWEGLAAIAMEFLPSFRWVEGVPRGGLRFAAALAQYARVDSDRLLVVDDVWTTGGSMKRHLDAKGIFRNASVIGLVAFARNPVEPWVTALFQMPGTPIALQRPLVRDML